MDLFSSGTIKQHDIEIDDQDLIQISAISEILNAFKKIWLNILCFESKNC